LGAICGTNNTDVLNVSNRSLDWRNKYKFWRSRGSAAGT
jgi:hypothetical protein